MALRHYNVTLAATATRVTTVANRKPLRYLHIHNPSGNSNAYVGASTVSATSYGHILAAGEEMTIGPFSGDAPFNSDEVWIFGTQNDVIHCLAVTH